MLKTALLLALAPLVAAPHGEDDDTRSTEEMFDFISTGNHTFRTKDVAWETDLDEAFARAKREDKPLVLATFTRENGDPDCDV